MTGPNLPPPLCGELFYLRLKLSEWPSAFARAMHLADFASDGWCFWCSCSLPIISFVAYGYFSCMVVSFWLIFDISIALASLLFSLWTSPEMAYPGHSFYDTSMSNACCCCICIICNTRWMFVFYLCQTGGYVIELHPISSWRCALN